MPLKTNRKGSKVIENATDFFNFRTFVLRTKGERHNNVPSLQIHYQRGAKLA